MIEFGSGTLYITTGNTIEKLANISPNSVFDLDEDGYADDFEYVGWSKAREVTLNFTTQVPRLTWLSLYHGRKVTNNWLKMQGGIMGRKTNRRSIRLSK